MKSALMVLGLFFLLGAGIVFCWGRQFEQPSREEVEAVKSARTYRNFAAISQNATTYSRRPETWERSAAEESSEARQYESQANQFTHDRDIHLSHARLATDLGLAVAFLSLLLSAWFPRVYRVR
jgi:hypothetical protein